MMTGTNSGANSLTTLLGIMSGPKTVLVFKVDRDVRTSLNDTRRSGGTGWMVGSEYFRTSKPSVNKGNARPKLNLHL